MLERSGIDHKATPIRYIGTGYGIPNTHSTMQDGRRDPNPNRLVGDQNITIEVTDTYDEAFALNQAVLRPNTVAIFNDPALRILMKPIYQVIKTEVKCTLRVSDRVIGENWRRAIKNRATLGATVQEHIVTYSYPIPTAYMVMLNEFYTMREATAGYGTTFAQWTQACFSPKYTILANQAGQANAWVVRENQIGIVGYYDFNYTPVEASNDNAAGYYDISFTYSFQYDRPESVALEYPLMVHNTMLSASFRDDGRPLEVSNYFRARTLSNALLNQFSYSKRGAHQWVAYPGLPIPYFDDWLPQYQLPKTINILRFQLSLDLPDVNTLIDLTQLGTFSLTDNALAYMRNRPNAMATAYDSVFQFQLHRWDQLMDMAQMQISPQLIGSYLLPLDPRDMYHLTMSLVSDPTILSRAALADLRDHGAFARDYYNWLHPGLGDNLYIDPFGKTTITAIQAINGQLAKFKSLTFSNPAAPWCLVGQYNIVALRS
jgi:hypothetical protein